MLWRFWSWVIVPLCSFLGGAGGIVVALFCALKASDAYMASHGGHDDGGDFLLVLLALVVGIILGALGGTLVGVTLTEELKRKKSGAFAKTPSSPPAQASSHPPLASPSSPQQQK